jgi:hypothetical protein
MNQLPLFFSFAQPVFGNGFVAGVHMNGCALMESEGSEIWISGVAPVGITAGGSDRGSAFAAFRNAWISVLFDIAAESSTFEDFRRSCASFLEARVETLTQEWQRAVDEVRRTKYVDPTLKNEPTDGHKISYGVVDFTGRSFTPNENVVEQDLKLAAA